MNAITPVLQPDVRRPGWIARVRPAHAVALLIALAIAVRAIGLDARPLWLDEAYSAWFSARSWHYLWTVVPTYEPHPPFYYSLLKLWRMLVGSDPAALRALSVLLGAAAVPVTMSVARELERLMPTGRPKLSVAIAGFLAAISPMLIFLDQESRPYPLLILAYAIAVLGLVRLMRDFAAGGRGAWASWLLLGSGTEIALWAHGLGLLYGACLAAALVPAWIKRPFPGARMLRGLAVAAAVLLAYAPCLLMILSRAGDWGSGWLDWRPLKLLELLALYTVPFELLTAASLVAGLVMILLAKRAVHSAFAARGWNGERALLILSLGPPLLAATISAFVLPVFLLRALAPALVPFYVAIARAVARTPGKPERTVLAAALVITLIPPAVQVALRPASEPWDQVRLYLQQHAAPGDEVWLYPNDSALPLDAAGAHGFRERGIPGDYPAVGFTGPVRAGSPAVVSVTGAQAEAIAANAAPTLPVIWLVRRQSKLFDPQDDVPRALARVRRPGTLRQWGYISVQPYYARAR